MLTDTFDVSEFNLVENLDYSPNTGIKIDYTVQESYQAQSTFRFTDATASKDAFLKDLIVSSGSNVEESTKYKEYELTPSFDKDINEYEITLLEYIEKLNITAIQNDEKSTMKIKYPKRDETGKIEYEEDGTTIIYEEKELINNEAFEVTLNELGKEDTTITVQVTAEDNKTINEYKVKIKRPYGTIKGSIYLKPMKSIGKYISMVRVYKKEDVDNVIDWKEVKEGKRDNIHEQLISLESINIETNEDGTYKIYVIPGEYDILLDKEGYLDYIIIDKTINEGEILELGEKELLAGDVNKDGVIQLIDLSTILKSYETKNTDTDYNKDLDFNEDGKIQLVDLSILLGNYETNRKVE